MKLLEVIYHLLWTLLIELTLLLIQKKLIEDTEATKTKIVVPTIKHKMEKKEQISIDNDQKQDQARHENSLMKKAKTKNELKNEEGKTRERLKKKLARMN